jgi:hypothetical protein
MRNNTSMTIKGESVVLAGKLRGYIYTATLTDGSVYRRFVPSKAKQSQSKEMDNMRINRVTGQTYMNVQPKQPLIRPVKQVDKVDIPDFMKQRSSAMQRARKEQNKQTTTFADVLKSLIK